MAYENIVWLKDEGVQTDKINKMLGNDQYLYDYLMNGPRGIIAWKSRTSDCSAVASLTPVTISGMSFNFTAEADRLYKVSYSYRSVDSTGSSFSSLAIAPYIDEVSYVGSFTFDYTASFNNDPGYGASGIVGGLLAGTHSFALKANLTYAGGTAVRPVIKANSAYPFNVWIEDVGTSIGKLQVS